MESLMHLKDDDILEISLLEATDNEPWTFLNLIEEATFSGEDPTSQDALEAATHPYDHLEETPSPKVQPG